MCLCAFFTSGEITVTNTFQCIRYLLTILLTGKLGVSFQVAFSLPHVTAWVWRCSLNTTHACAVNKSREHSSLNGTSLEPPDKLVGLVGL